MFYSFILVALLVALPATVAIEDKCKPNCDGCENIDSDGYNTCREATLYTFTNDEKTVSVHHNMEFFKCNISNSKQIVLLDDKELVKVECIPYRQQLYTANKDVGHPCFSRNAFSHYKKIETMIPLGLYTAEFACDFMAIVRFADSTTETVNAQSLRISCSKDGSVSYKHKSVRELECSIFASNLLYDSL